MALPQTVLASFGALYLMHNPCQPLQAACLSPPDTKAALTQCVTSINLPLSCLRTLDSASALSRNEIPKGLCIPTAILHVLAKMSSLLRSFHDFPPPAHCELLP